MHSRNAESEPARLTANFEGRVQGVGFRFTVVDLALKSSAVGFVRNDSDGSVTVVAEGKRADLEALVNAIRGSSLGPFIRREHIAWGPALREFETFDIRYW